jgi:hypothetical protein
MSQKATTLLISESITLTKSQVQDDRLVLAGHATNPVELTLPLDAANGARVTLKRSGPTDVTLIAQGTQVIEGNATKVISVDGHAFSLQYIEDDAWAIVASYEPVS